jgi:hypothetical protein
VVRFPPHKELEIVEVEKETEEVVIKKGKRIRKVGDIPEKMLYKLYEIRLNHNQMQGLANELAKYFDVMTPPKVHYSLRKPPIDRKTGLPINGEYISDAETMIFHLGQETVGAFVHQFAHHLQIHEVPYLTTPLRHGSLFKVFQRFILETNVFWDTLKKLGKVKEEDCRKYKLDWRSA